MEHVLSFFSDLILFTFGLAVLIFWIILIILVIDEIIGITIAIRNRKDAGL